MTLRLFLKGLVIGISIAAPVGPIGVLCIQRTLAGGRWYGLVSGLGAATADAVYGLIAAFGLTVVSSVLVEQQIWLRLIGGGFLCYLGVRAFRSRPADEAAQTEAARGYLRAYSSTFGLTLTNPMTILAFAAIFAGLGIVSADGGYAAASLLVVGVFLGSGLWWLFLSSAASLWRGRVTPRQLGLINKISGGVIFAFGLLALVSIR